MQTLSAPQMPSVENRGALGVAGSSSPRCVRMSPRVPKPGHCPRRAAPHGDLSQRSAGMSQVGNNVRRYDTDTADEAEGRVPDPPKAPTHARSEQLRAAPQTTAGRPETTRTRTAGVRPPHAGPGARGVTPPAGRGIGRQRAELLPTRPLLPRSLVEKLRVGGKLICLKVLEFIH